MRGAKNTFRHQNYTKTTLNEYHSQQGCLMSIILTRDIVVVAVVLRLPLKNFKGLLWFFGNNSSCPVEVQREITQRTCAPTINGANLKLLLLLIKNQQLINICYNIISKLLLLRCIFTDLSKYYIFIIISLTTNMYMLELILYYKKKERPDHPAIPFIWEK